MIKLPVLKSTFADRRAHTGHRSLLNTIEMGFTDRIEKIYKPGKVVIFSSHCNI